VRESLADLLADLGRHEEAVPEYRAVIDAKERVLGWSDPETRATRDMLTELLEEMRKPAR
jgi:hypothetical protein